MAMRPGTRAGSPQPQGGSARETLQKLQSLIEDIRVAMLVTRSDEGLHGRPMETLRTPFDGRLWFFTSSASPKALEIEEDAEVGLVYADARGQRHVFVTGSARLVRDPARIDALWSPEQAVWFPGGKNDPDLRLLQVTATRALYWIRGIGAAPGMDESGTLELEARALPGAEGAAAEHTRPRVAGADRSAHNTGRVSTRH